MLRKRAGNRVVSACRGKYVQPPGNTEVGISNCSVEIKFAANPSNEFELTTRSVGVPEGSASNLISVRLDLLTATRLTHVVMAATLAPSRQNPLGPYTPLPTTMPLSQPSIQMFFSHQELDAPVISIHVSVDGADGEDVPINAQFVNDIPAANAAPVGSPPIIPFQHSLNM